MKELERIRDVLKDVYKQDRAQLEKYQEMGPDYYNMTEYNRGRAAATALAISLIEQHMKFLEEQEAKISKRR